MTYHIAPGWGFSKAFLVGVDPAKDGSERTVFMLPPHDTVKTYEFVFDTLTLEQLAFLSGFPEPTEQEPPRCLRPTPWNKE